MITFGCKVKAGHPPIDVPLSGSITLEGGYIVKSRSKRPVIADYLRL